MNPSEAKNELNQFAQRHCKRPVTKSDIVYTVSKYGSQYQAIVKLNCLGGQEYAGHLCGDQKAAEKSAAAQALQANASLVEATKAAPAASSNKRGPPKVLTPEERAAKKARADAGEVNPAITPKTELNSLVMRIVQRYLKKGETVYNCNKIGAQYQATVQLSCLPDEWGQRAWAGHLSATKQKAEQSAAEQALIDIKGDENLRNLAAAPKGMGKGGKGQPDWYGIMAAMASMASWNWGGANNWSKERERVMESDIVGTCVEWKGNYGWLKTEEDFDHPAKEKRDGKIYINKKDIEGTPETLAEGQKIKFKLYADGSGLGAEEATLI
eukprot:gb/GFBE01022088.1/.p1 GENE.gb/GFBE01022088.1/~~gb/GFBE01022088.1/.p1  ORF type:complete len:326 (+),score=94.99 gb/GFBE01022088.1/:1-978(+)